MESNVVPCDVTKCSNGDTRRLLVLKSCPEQSAFDPAWTARRSCTLQLPLAPKDHGDSGLALKALDDLANQVGDDDMLTMLDDAQLAVADPREHPAVPCRETFGDREAAKLLIRRYNPDLSACPPASFHEQRRKPIVGSCISIAPERQRRTLPLDTIRRLLFLHRADLSRLDRAEGSDQLVLVKQIQPLALDTERNRCGRCGGSRHGGSKTW